MLPRTIFLCGPTASGKSAKAIELAAAYNGEIINADAMQLYRGMEVLTAAPDPIQRVECPHHLYGDISPEETCDAAHFLSLAQPLIAQIHTRGKSVIVTGGSGLCLKFLSHGPSPLPPGDAAIRLELEALDLAQLQEKLLKLDPESAATINPQNRRYLTRAIEISLITGKPAAAQRRHWATECAHRRKKLQGILLSPPREVLHTRIARRAEEMLEHGAIEEVAAIRHSLSHTASKAIGVKQISLMLDGKLTRAQCLKSIIEATRQYAKRQLTWLRRETWLKSED
jgi:tRNA dimethylallyltransferase